MLNILTHFASVICLLLQNGWQRKTLFSSAQRPCCFLMKQKVWWLWLSKRFFFVHIFKLGGHCHLKQYMDSAKTLIVAVSCSEVKIWRFENRFYHHWSILVLSYYVLLVTFMFKMISLGRTDKAERSLLTWNGLFCNLNQQHFVMWEAASLALFWP